ncbi:MAG: aminoglycoside phosphotransferase family protein [Bacteroidales bacterium]|nr:aminoglycoside phosphotransferase family protein [Bacteroidales bacterium]
MFDFKNILKNFKIAGNFSEAKAFGSGHINDTFLVKILGKNQKKYVLQRKNGDIFKNIPGLVNNMKIATEHIRKKLIEKNTSNIDEKVLSMIPCFNGENYFLDNENNYWCLYDFIDNCKSYNIADTFQKAVYCGEAFGEFIYQLSGLDTNLCVETIPEFHNVIIRLNNFHKAVDSNISERVCELAEEIFFVEEREEEMKTFYSQAKNIMPKRIIHNDTKLNNVLFDENDNILCVVDLDTVMPGLVLYDFGDAIRTISNPCSEDEKDVSKIIFNIEMYEAFAKGFLNRTGNILTKPEIENLACSAKLMTFIIGLRFLTDYIEGDVYFKIAHPKHNLERAKVQFKLLSSMEENFDKMQEIITKFFETEDLKLRTGD